MIAPEVPTGIPEFTLRFAKESDVPTIHRLIVGLADYEKLRHEVVATPGVLQESLFGDAPSAEVILGIHAGETVAMAIFFHNFSTFLGRRGLYLEDLFVVPEARGRGFGGAMLGFLAELAVERGCGRFEWSVLDWNRSAIDFYEKLGARPNEGWLGYRLTGAPLSELAERSRRRRG